MSVTEARSPKPLGDALVEELKWVHNMIRRDRATVRQMAADVAAGLTAGTCARNSPRWRPTARCGS